MALLCQVWSRAKEKTGLYHNWLFVREMSGNLKHSTSISSLASMDRGNNNDGKDFVLIYIVPSGCLYINVGLSFDPCIFAVFPLCISTLHNLLMITVNVNVLAPWKTYCFIQCSSGSGYSCTNTLMLNLLLNIRLEWNLNHFI